MAVYQQSPQPSANLMAGSRPPQLHRASPTPPPLSKRDKRRNAMMDRLQDISNNFAENREFYYRRQLQALQRDVNHITHAKPYLNRPLDELLDNLDEEHTTAIAGMRGGQHRSMNGDGEERTRAGEWTRRFIEEVDNAMEDRDAQLSLVMERHSFRVAELKEDHLYHTTRARKECDGLLINLRDRLTKIVSDKRAALLKERDKADSFDATSLLVHPSQLGFANPASPGGPQSNRKTRHTRHRLDMEEVGPGGENKRKRKLVAEADEGSPGPSNRLADGEPSAPSRDSRSKAVTYQPLTSAYSLDTLFSEKELVSVQQEASYAAIQEIAQMRKKNKSVDRDSTSRLEASTLRARINGRKSVQPNGSTNPTTANVTDTEDNADNTAPQTDGTDEESSDDIFLTAPAMDRTANSSLHATRSTRNNHLGFLNHGSSLHTLGDLAGRAATIKLLGTYNKDYSKDRKQSDDTIRAPPATDYEVEDDLARIAAAIKEHEKTPGKMDTKLVEEVCAEQVDYTNDPSAGYSDLRGSRRSSGNGMMGLAVPES
ncbi:MAG: hypothetical protein Q9216_005237 [Gyalolechia sp. 2 TL-2023]